MDCSILIPWENKISVKNRTKNKIKRAFHLQLNFNSHKSVQFSQILKSSGVWKILNLPISILSLWFPILNLKIFFSLLKDFGMISKVKVFYFIYINWMKFIIYYIIIAICIRLIWWFLDDLKHSNFTRFRSNLTTTNQSLLRIYEPVTLHQNWIFRSTSRYYVAWFQVVSSHCLEVMCYYLIVSKYYFLFNEVSCMLFLGMVSTCQTTLITCVILQLQ